MFTKFAAWWKRLTTRESTAANAAPPAPEARSQSASSASLTPEQLQGDTFRLLERMLSTLVDDRKSERRAAIIKRVLFLLLLLVPLLYLTFSGFDPHTSRREGVAVPVIRIDGVIGNDSEGMSARALVPVLERAFYGPGQRVVLLINSPGGSPADAERIRAAIVDLKRSTNKRVDAIIDRQGASAAYMIALAADSITAGRYSMVGSIGVIMETWDASELANKNGLRTHIYKSGDAKALGGYMHAPTAAEQRAATELIDSLAALFKADVLKYRADKLQADVNTLATGRVWVGPEALALGLIDRIATPEEFFSHEQIRPTSTGGKAPTLRNLTRGLLDALKDELPTALSPMWR